MSRRTITTVRAKIDRLRASGKTWAEAARRAGIVKKNGEPDTGMAYQIAHNKREPVDRETRERLKLIAICVTCRRPLPRPKLDRPARQMTDLDWWLRGIPSKQKREIWKLVRERKWNELDRLLTYLVL